MDDLTDPIANMVRGAQYLQEHLPEWFDKNYSVWVDSSTQARQAKENNMSTKKVSAGDTLTVGDLTDDHLGAVIEVEVSDEVTTRLRLGLVNPRGRSTDTGIQKTIWACDEYPVPTWLSSPVTVIAPPPVVQPDAPTILGQCIRIEGDYDWLGIVADPQGDNCRIWDTGGYWVSWGSVLTRAGERQIIVSDPPRWPDETPEPPERIEEGEWPDDDTHLRAWVWIEVADGWPWWWDAQANRWRSEYMTSDGRRPPSGPWARAERVE